MDIHDIDYTSLKWWVIQLAIKQRVGPSEKLEIATNLRKILCVNLYACSRWNWINN